MTADAIAAERLLRSAIEAGLHARTCADGVCPTCDAERDELGALEAAWEAREVEPWLVAAERAGFWETERERDEEAAREIWY